MKITTQKFALMPGIPQLDNPILQRFLGDLSQSVQKLQQSANNDLTSLKTNSDIIFSDTTSGDVTETLPLLADNWGLRIKIIHAKGGTNKIIINPHADNANTLTTDELASIWLPKLGDYIEFYAHEATGLWQAIGERISSGLWLDTYAGYGTTDNKIPKFTTAVEDYGNMFSHNHGSYGVHGLELTINRSGKYGILFYYQTDGSASNAGLSLGSNQLTTAIGAITLGHRLNMITLAGSYIGPLAVSKYFSKNNIIRPHTSGNVPSTAEHVKLLVHYLGN